MTTELLEKPGTQWPDWLEDIRSEYGSLSQPKLLSEFKALMVGTVDNIRRQAVLIRLLEENGADLSDIKSPWLDDLRRVAYGQLVPELITLGTRNRSILRQAKSLPVPDQMKIAKDEPIPVMVHREGAGYEPRQIKPSQMEDWQVRQVLSSGRIRSEKEQVDFLDRPQNRHRRPAEPIVVDMKSKQLIISGERVVLSLEQLVEYVSKFTRAK